MQQSLTSSRRRTRAVRWTPLALALLLLGAAVLLATGVGTVHVSPAGVLESVVHGVTGTVDGATDTIIWRIRLPRVLMAALVGAALAVSGAAYQGVFRNPLADPYLLGVASGASLGAAIAIVFAGVPLVALLGLRGLSFGFGLLAVFLVIGLARRANTLPQVPLILAGVVLSSSFTAATSFLMLSSRDQTANVLSWLLGSFAFSSWTRLGDVVPLVLVAVLLTLLSARALNLMQLGEAQAAQLGLAVEPFKYGLIVVSTLATAAAVSVAGIIGFVGLMVPHAARLAFGSDYRTLVPMSVLFGATFMVLADLLARTVIAPAEMPIGVITALAGGPFFLYLLQRRKGSSL